MRAFLPLVAAGVLAYAAIVLAMYLTQDRLLYHPPPGEGDPSRLGLAPWPDTDAPMGYASAIPRPAPRGTILVWHGNAGSALDRAYFTHALEPRGFRVVLLEFPGYGRRPGSPGEAAFVADGETAARLAVERFGRPLYLLGESMGCAVATAVAGRADVEGVVLITPWADLPSLAQSAYPLLPARWLVRDRFDNVRNLTRYPGPVAVGMSRGDEVIPNRETERLFHAIASRKRMWTFEAGHNTWPTQPTAPWWDEVLGFLEE